MGRPSTLSDAEKAVVLRQVVVDKRSLSSVSKEWGLSKTRIHAIISERSGTLKSAVEATLEAERQMAALPIPERIVAMDVLSELRSLASNLMSAAQSGARTASKLQAMAENQVAKINPEAPMDSAEELQAVAGLTRMANDASRLGMEILSANKTAKGVVPPDEPKQGCIDVKQLSTSALLELQAAYANRGT